MSVADLADLRDSVTGWPLCENCSDPVDPDEPHTDCEHPMATYLLDVECHDPNTLLDETIVRRFQVSAAGDAAAIETAEVEARACGLDPIAVYGVGHAAPGHTVGPFTACVFCGQMVERCAGGRGRWRHVRGYYGCRAEDIIRHDKREGST